VEFTMENPLKWKQRKIKMGTQLSMMKLGLVLLLASSVRAQPRLFDVKRYGATPNGDITMVRSIWLKSNYLRQLFFIYIVSKDL
jgi:hypothetical protein